MDSTLIDHKSDKINVGVIQLWDKGIMRNDRDLQTYIDSFHKEPEICAAYMEHSTPYFNNVVDITINIDSITPHKKQNGREEYCQIPFYENEINESITMRETTEPTMSNKIEPIESKIVDASKTIKQNARKTINAGKAKYFLTCIDNLLAESRQMTTPLGKSITRTLMTVMEPPSQILFLTTELGGSVSITNILRTDTSNQTNPNIKPTIIHLKQAKVPGHNDQNHFPIKGSNSGIDVPISRRNIDNRTRINPQGPIVTMIPESNRANNCDIFNLVNRMSDIAYRSSPSYGTMKIVIKNLVENLNGNNIFKNTERENNFEFKNVGRRIL